MVSSAQGIMKRIKAVSDVVLSSRLADELLVVEDRIYTHNLFSSG
jgi:hypothetical protein